MPTKAADVAKRTAGRSVTNPDATSQVRPIAPPARSSGERAYCSIRPAWSVVCAPPRRWPRHFCFQVTLAGWATGGMVGLEWYGAALRAALTIFPKFPQPLFNSEIESRKPFGFAKTTMQTIFDKFFVPADPRDRSAAELGRALATGFFTLARNVVLLGGIKFVADKSHSLPALMVYESGLVLLIIQIFSHWQDRDLRLFGRLSHRAWANIADVTIYMLAGLAVVIGSVDFVASLTSTLAAIH